MFFLRSKPLKPINLSFDETMTPEKGFSELTAYAFPSLTTTSSRLTSLEHDTKTSKRSNK